MTVALLLVAFGLRLGTRALFYDLFPDKVRQMAATGQAWLDSARARPLLTRPTKVLYRVDVEPTR